MTTEEKAKYRPLTAGEIVQAGDLYMCAGSWQPSCSAGRIVTENNCQYYRRLITASSPAQTTETTQTERHSMTVYRVAIIHTPSALDAQQGATESFVLPTVEVMANDKNHAVAVAVFENNAKLVAGSDGKPPGRWLVKVNEVF